MLSVDFLVWFPFGLEGKKVTRSLLGRLGLWICTMDIFPLELALKKKNTKCFIDSRVYFQELSCQLWKVLEMGERGKKKKDCFASYPLSR